MVDEQQLGTRRRGWLHVKHVATTAPKPPTDLPYCPVAPVAWNGEAKEFVKDDAIRVPATGNGEFVANDRLLTFRLIKRGDRTTLQSVQLWQASNGKLLTDFGQEEFLGKVVESRKGLIAIWTATEVRVLSTETGLTTGKYQQHNLLNARFVLDGSTLLTIGVSNPASTKLNQNGLVLGADSQLTTRFWAADTQRSPLESVTIPHDFLVKFVSPNGHYIFGDTVRGAIAVGSNNVTRFGSILNCATGEINDFGNGSLLNTREGPVVLTNSSSLGSMKFDTQAGSLSNYTISDYYREASTAWQGNLNPSVRRFGSSCMIASSEDFRVTEFIPIPNESTLIATNSNASVIATRSLEGLIVIQKNFPLEILSGIRAGGKVECMDFSRTGEALIVLINRRNPNRNTLQVFNSSTGKSISILPLPESGYLDHYSRPRACMASLPNDQFLFTCGSALYRFYLQGNRIGKIWDAGANLVCIAVSPLDPNLLAVATDRRIVLYSIAKREIEDAWDFPKQKSMTFSDNGKELIVIGSQRGMIKRFNLSAGIESMKAVMIPSLALTAEVKGISDTGALLISNSLADHEDNPAFLTSFHSEDQSWTSAFAAEPVFSGDHKLFAVPGRNGTRAISLREALTNNEVAFCQCEGKVLFSQEPSMFAVQEADAFYLWPLEAVLQNTESIGPVAARAAKLGPPAIVETGKTNESNKNTSSSETSKSLWATPKGLLLSINGTSKSNRRLSGFGQAKSRIIDGNASEVVKALIDANDFEQATEGITYVSEQSGEYQQYLLLKELISAALDANQLNVAKQAITMLFENNSVDDSFEVGIALAIKAGQLDLATELIANIPSPVNRAVAQVQIAIAAQQQGNAELALRTFVDAQQMIKDFVEKNQRGVANRPFRLNGKLMSEKTDVFYEILSDAFLRCQDTQRALEVSRLIIDPKKKIFALIEVANAMAEGNQEAGAGDVLAELTPLTSEKLMLMDRVYIIQHLVELSSKLGRAASTRETVEDMTEAIVESANRAKGNQTNMSPVPWLKPISIALAAIGENELALEIAGQFDDSAGVKSNLFSDISIKLMERGDLDDALQTALTIANQSKLAWTLGQLGARCNEQNLHDQRAVVVNELKKIEQHVKQLANTVSRQNSLQEVALAFASVEEYEAAIRAGTFGRKDALHSVERSNLDWAGIRLARGGEIEKALAMARLIEPPVRNEYLSSLVRNLASPGKFQFAMQAAEMMPDKLSAAWSRIHVVISAFREGSQEEALEYFRAALQALKAIDPKDRVYVSRQFATDLASAKLPEQALEVALTVKQEPMRTQLIYQCANAFAELRDCAKALEAIQVIEQHIRIPACHANLAVLLAKSDCPDLALEVLRQCEALKWHSTPVLNAMIEARTRASDFEDALQLSEEHQSAIDSDRSKGMVAKAIADSNLSNRVDIASKAIQILESINDQEIRDQMLFEIALTLATDSFPKNHPGIEPVRSMKDSFSLEDRVIAEMLANAARGN